jgi:O-antigen ligase
VFLLATIAALLRVRPDESKDRAVVGWAAVYLLVILAVTLNAGISRATVGNAIDVGLLPYLYLSVLYPRARSLPLGNGIAFVAMAVLAFEVIVGWREFVTGTYLIHFTGANAPLAYGADPTSTAIRATGTFATTETYSLFCALLGLFLAVYWARRNRGFVGAACAAVALAGCMFSGTRDTVLIFVPLIVVVYLRAGASPTGRAIRIALATLPALLIANQLFHPLATSTISGRLNNQGNIDSRIAAFNAAWHVFLNHPLTGVGFGRYTDVSSQGQYAYVFRGVLAAPTPHNTYLAVLAETGAIGAVVFAGLWLAILRRLWRSDAREIAVPLALLLLGTSLADNLGQEAPALIATLFFVGISAYAAPVRQTVRLPSPGRSDASLPEEPHLSFVAARFMG